MRMGKREYILIMNMIIILLIMILVYESFAESEKYEWARDISEFQTDIYADESEYCDIRSVSESKIEIQQNDKNIYEKEFTENEKYLLAKIAMAEAENQNIQTKTLVIMVILNRVESEDFPDSILEVIFQSNDKIYQFSPVMQNGRWWSVEPNEDCYEAVEVVLSTEHNYSNGALYFESCKGDSWHNKNLTYMYQSGDLRFYK